MFAFLRLQILLPPLLASGPFCTHSLLPNFAVTFSLFMLAGISNITSVSSIWTSAARSISNPGRAHWRYRVCWRQRGQWQTGEAHARGTRVVSKLWYPAFVSVLDEGERSLKHMRILQYLAEPERADRQLLPSLCRCAVHLFAHKEAVFLIDGLVTAGWTSCEVFAIVVGVRADDAHQRFPPRRREGL